MAVKASEVTVEQRLAALEHNVAELRTLLAPGPPPTEWLKKFIGSISDEVAFREVLDLGRTFRAADRPPDNADDAR
jgi:hypothetical protein